MTADIAITEQTAAEQKWQHFLGLVHAAVGPELYANWFSDARLVSLDGRRLTIAVRSNYVRELYEDRFSEPFLTALEQTFGTDIEIYWSVGVIAGDDQANMLVSGAGRGHKAPKAPLGADIEETCGLKPEYTFANYCVGDSNRLAYTIARSIADHPESPDFNPFFLYGPVGVGKTHLIQAIGIALKQRNPQSRVLFVSMRNFQNQYQVASQQGKVPDFINFYQSIDVLLIDDIQELGGKKGTMDTLFPIFNYLHGSNRKLLFTCDRAPSSLEGVTDRLIDRFKWGSTEMLNKPDPQLRRAILRHKASAGGLELPESVIDIIADNVTGSVRELEGVVASLILRAVTLSVPITEQLALEEALKMARPRQRTVNFDMIVEFTAESFRINPDVIYSKSKVRDIADARQVIMYLAAKHLPLSQTAIGQRLRRSHSTVLHGIRTIENRLSVARDLRALIDAIEHDLEK